MALTWVQLLEYGVGALAVLLMGYMAIQLIQNQKETQEDQIPVKEALERNTIAISKLSSVLELQHEYNKEHRASQDKQMDRIEEKLDRLQDEHQDHMHYTNQALQVVKGGT